MANEIKCECGHNIFVPDSEEFIVPENDSDTLIRKEPIKLNDTTKFITKQYFKCNKCSKRIPYSIQVSNDKVEIKITLTKK